MIFAKRTVLFAGLWVVLTGADTGALIAGAMAALNAALVSLRLLPRGDHEVRWIAVLRLLPGFLFRSVEGGLDVARRAFHPRLPLNPGWKMFRSRLPVGAPRVSLGTEVSLLPGTLVAGSEGDHLLVHCLDRDQPIELQLAREDERIASTLHVVSLE